MTADDDALTGIHAVAEQLGVTPRTLRLYEDKGLIHPVRVGNNRAYGHRDIVRMRLILRGKRLGFSLREIQEFLDLYAETDQKEQMRTLAARCRSRIDTLNLQRQALDQTVAELEELEKTALAHLDERRGGVAQRPA
ncbi:MerR family DNA-binding transcriptional regulator [Sphingomonas sp. 2R-10]|uniref:MerR family transcriptional regulator n=1 Tax=Sphingomonas sp. 2R-10 TaxID=3045148 RepID=UPI0019D04591|nr:MerR family DNA-binding transcriptional regulator [Sphingomonas sp. 2R-10]MDJ0278217.1 MerR family DNA-binding transcriptional regulator [Sphingomonas sp. 2R-10]